MFGVILLAGGKGLRFGMELPKQFVPLNGERIFAHSLNLFFKNPQISEFVIVCGHEFQSMCREALQKMTRSDIPVQFAEPGERRQDSVFNGLNKLGIQSQFVCVHDAARPLLKAEHFEKLLEGAQHTGAAALGVPLKFTVKECESNGKVICTPSRERFWEIQTPQVVKRSWLEEGFNKAIQDNITVTDDVSLVELLGYPVKIVQGDYSNIKITTPEDLILAEQLLRN